MRRFGACSMVLVYLLTFVVPGLVPGLVRYAVAQNHPSPAELSRILGVPPMDGTSAGEASQRAARAFAAGFPGVPNAGGLASNMSANSALSAAVITSLGGPFLEATLLGDWDGREDLVADHSGTPFGTTGPAVLTRAAISEHTIANGFAENIFYVGDSVGNVFVVASTSLSGPPTAVTTLNLPTLLNAFGTLNSDSHIVITGVCINPVSDLQAFPNVNGSFAPFAGLIGELLVVTFWDAGGGSRFNSTTGAPIRSGVLAFPIADVVSPAAAPPGVQSALGFPVTVGGAFGEAFSVFANLAGCAIDDDGSVYFQNVDLVTFTGANIVKITRTGTNQDRSLATSSFGPTITTLNPPGGLYGTATGPATQVSTYTNYSGTSTLFGNITALAAGPGSTLYAAVARSRVATDDAATQATEGFFANPAGLPPTPSMIISFADYASTGGLPAADGFADPVVAGGVVPGVNNFRVFAQGTGPDARTGSPALGSAFDTLKLEFQVDYTLYSGLTVDEDRKVYVVSGGTPAGVGLDPSPFFGEIMVFTDHKPADRRADFVDLRTTGTLPSPVGTGANAGDGVSDRFDHIFWQAPTDPTTFTPAGVAGLSRGFLMYLNRTRTNVAAFPNLPNGTPQGDDATSGPNTFSSFDTSEQVAGGDDGFFPFKGDNAASGFEFVFGGNIPACTTPWTSFFLNSNGSVSFNAGDTDNTATIAEHLTGVPRIAGAWTDVNPNGRAVTPSAFPVQALGFAAPNHFKVRWINVPEFGFEATSRNTFSISLFDDGTGVDESSPASQEGPTDLRFAVAPTPALVGVPPRAENTGKIVFEYGRMDVQGTALDPVIVGYSAGALPAASVGETNLGEAGRAAFAGDGTQAAIFELFSASDFDLRSEGNGVLLSTSPTQPDLNREYVELFGRSCSAPPAPTLPRLTLSLGQSNLHPGQTLTLNVNLVPGTLSGPVNAFIVVQVPTGQFFSLTPGGFVPGVVPAATGFTPIPFSAPVLSAPLPAGLPFGTYTFFSALTLTGVPFVIGDQSDIYQVPFDFLP